MFRRPGPHIRVCVQHPPRLSVHYRQDIPRGPAPGHPPAAGLGLRHPRHGHRAGRHPGRPRLLRLRLLLARGRRHLLRDLHAALQVCHHISLVFIHTCV